ncbi:MAG: helix-turn-helix protein [Gammaproteobacteria bacterium]|jgi:prophage regulatory protein|nr:helix-turn-helix protein [Gammaproteobacteria bacterium]
MNTTSKFSPQPSATMAGDATPASSLQYLRISDVCRLLRISKPTLWRLRQSSDFPAPTRLSDRAIGWSRNEIQTWVDARRRPTQKHRDGTD